MKRGEWMVSVFSLSFNVQLLISFLRTIIYTNPETETPPVIRQKLSFCHIPPPPNPHFLIRWESFKLYAYNQIEKLTKDSCLQSVADGVLW